LIIENGKVTDIETDQQQKNVSVLRDIMQYETESIFLNIGLNDAISLKSYYSLFDMTRNKSLSLAFKNSQGTIIALSETGSLFTAEDNSLLEEL
jgi:hypothetical protein